MKDVGIGCLLGLLAWVGGVAFAALVIMLLELLSSR